MGAQEIILEPKGGERLLSLLYWGLYSEIKKNNNNNKKKQEPTQYTKRIQPATLKTLVLV